MSDLGTPPNPGSDEAIELGCICPVIDNGHGRGYFGDGAKYGFVVREDCPLHGGGDFLQTDESRKP